MKLCLDDDRLVNVFTVEDSVYIDLGSHDRVCTIKVSQAELSMIIYLLNTQLKMRPIPELPHIPSPA